MRAIGKILSWYLRAMILVISGYYMVGGDYFASLLCVFGFFVSLLPLMVDAMYNVHLHWIFELAFSVMLFWHMFGFFGAYDMFPMWDEAGHVFGGATLGLIGFAWLYSMNVSERVKMSLPMIGLVSVTWSATAGVVWEIVEFLWDSASGLVSVYGMMQNGLIDTMTDLSLDLVAAMCMVLVCVYIVRNARYQTSRIINPFVRIIENRNKG